MLPPFYSQNKISQNHCTGKEGQKSRQAEEFPGKQTPLHSPTFKSSKSHMQNNIFFVLRCYWLHLLIEWNNKSVTAPFYILPVSVAMIPCTSSIIVYTFSHITQQMETFTFPPYVTSINAGLCTIFPHLVLVLTCSHFSDDNTPEQ